MLAKLSTIAYVKVTQYQTQGFTVKEITAVSRLSEDDPTKVSYLKIKAFIPLDREIETQIEDFNTEDVIFLRGKFMVCPGWYLVCMVIIFLPLFFKLIKLTTFDSSLKVNATSIKLLGNFDFNNMP